MDKRKNLRERSYAKYLRDAKVKACPLNQLTIEEKAALSIRRDEERGSLLELYEAHRKFIGISILRSCLREKNIKGSHFGFSETFTCCLRKSEAGREPQGSCSFFWRERRRGKLKFEKLANFSSQSFVAVLQYFHFVAYP